jgi:hypothetical protein
MTRPLIQIDEDGNSREMTEEEHNFYLELWEEAKKHAPPTTDIDTGTSAE